MRVESEMTIHPALDGCFLDYAASAENRPRDRSIKREEKEFKEMLNGEILLRKCLSL
jgi:hypothetical protein